MVAPIQFNRKKFNEVFDDHIIAVQSMAEAMDAIVDPIGRAAMVFLAGALYDAVAKRFAEDEPQPPWPALPKSSARPARPT